VNANTALAIEAFRRHLGITKKLQRSEHQLTMAIRRVPPNETDIYALQTEILLQEDERAEADRVGDTDSRDFIDKTLVGLREQLKTHEAAVVAQGEGDDQLTVDEAASQYLGAVLKEDRRMSGPYL
jgi:hypothetical protein